MKIDIDQSGRVEFTSHDTVIADSLGNSVFIKAREKRILEKAYTSSGRRKMFMFEVFSLLTTYLIKNSFCTTHLYYVDIEYDGRMPLIKERILYFAHKISLPLDSAYVYYRSIGKSSLAHVHANNTFSGKQKPTFEITAQAVLSVILAKKKTGVLR
jgi:hypothetical protein